MFKYQTVSSFKERPSENTRYLIQRNLDSLINICIRQAKQFVNTNQTKLKALQQLKYAVLIGQNAVTKQIEIILQALVKIWQMDIDNSHPVILQIVEIVGYHVKTQIYIPLIISILQQQQYKNSPKNTIVLLILLGHLLVNAQGIENYLPQILGLIEHYQKIFYQNDEGLISICQIAITIVKRVQKLTQPKFINIIFSIFLDIQSTKTISQSIRQKAILSMNRLSQLSNFNSLAQLHANQIGPILQKIIKQKQYVHWNKTSKNRFKFDTIIRNCYSQVGRFLSDILQILEFMINPQCDLEIRMDTLVLIQYILNIQTLREIIKPQSLRMLKKILIVAIQWKVGKPQIKIRKAGIINIISLINFEIINEEQLLQSFKQLLPPLKNCLNDDWAPQLRLASCQLVQKYLLATRDNIGDDQLRDLYPCLLERLDDSQDPIRKKVSVAINVFFSCRYLKFSASTLEYMINSIFVHFDDNNQEIQDCIFTTLKFASRIDPKQVLNAGQLNLKRMKHQQKCKQLIEYCLQILEQKKI